MIRLLIFSVSIFSLVSCGTSRILITSQNQRVDINFIEKPKKLKAGTTYNLNIIDKENSESPLYPTINNGMISRQSTPKQPPFLYKLKPYESGALILDILIEDTDGNFIIIDRITIENK